MEAFVYYDLQGFADELVRKLHDANDLTREEIIALESLPELILATAKLMSLSDQRLDGDLPPGRFLIQMHHQQQKLIEVLEYLKKRQLLQLFSPDHKVGEAA